VAPRIPLLLKLCKTPPPRLCKRRSHALSQTTSSAIAPLRSWLCLRRSWNDLSILPPPLKKCLDKQCVVENLTKLVMTQLRLNFLAQVEAGCQSRRRSCFTARVREMAAREVRVIKQGYGDDDGSIASGRLPEQLGKMLQRFLESEIKKAGGLGGRSLISSSLQDHSLQHGCRGCQPSANLSDRH